MVTNTGIDWFQPKTHPIPVRLHYDFSGGEHPLTPPDIRARFVAEGCDFVLWRHIEADAFGFRSGRDELAWRLDDIRSFEFGFWRPAKGGGSIYISTLLRGVSEPRWLISCSGFTPELLDWFRQVSKILADWFPDRVLERDHGYDA
jgi:hypothetical protein